MELDVSLCETNKPTQHNLHCANVIIWKTLIVDNLCCVLFIFLVISCCIWRHVIKSAAPTSLESDKKNTKQRRPWHFQSRCRLHSTDCTMETTTDINILTSTTSHLPQRSLSSTLTLVKTVTSESLWSVQGQGEYLLQVYWIARRTRDWVLGTY